MLDKPVETVLRQVGQSRAISFQVSMMQCFREVFSVFLYCFYWPPKKRLLSIRSPKSSHFGRCSSGILCPPELEAFKERMNTLYVSTSVSGTLSCYLIWSNFRRHRMWKEFSCLAWRLCIVCVLQTYSIGRTIARYIFSWSLFSPTRSLWICHKPS